MNKYINFKAILNAFRRDEERRKRLEKYEQTIEPLEGINDIRETAFYKKHLALFHIPPNVRLLKGSGCFISQELLMRLILASFASEWELEVDEAWLEAPSPEIKLSLTVTVSSEGKAVTKSIDDLGISQIKSLFFIYIDEQMSHAIDRMEDDEHDKLLGEKLEKKAADFNRWMTMLESKAQIYLID